MRDFIDEYYGDKDLSLLNKLTLIIPTHNRNYYLSRCLWYHAHFPFGEIIVADSSPEEKKVVNRETVEKIRDMFGSKILYLEYEPETEKYGGDIYRKWGDAVQHVETVYSEFCTDKEFVIPTTVCTCIEFLDLHPDFSIAEGRDCLINQFKGDEMIFSPWQGDSSFEQETPEERLDACLQYNQIVGTLFSVQRSSNQKKIYSNLPEYNIYDIRFGEIALEKQPFLFGKTKKIKDLVYNCRDVRHANIYTSLKTKTNKLESSYSRYPLYEDYSPKIISELSKNLGMCFDTLYSQIYNTNGNHRGQLCSSYVIKLMEKRYLASSSILRRSRILRNLWRKLPITIQRYLSVHFGSGAALVEPLEKTKEMKIIQEIILKYDHLHELDMPIVSR